MELKNVKSIMIPEGVVAKITCGDFLLWKKSKFTNLVPLSINADGSIYNNGLGYKTGVRVRSGGAETDNSDGIVCGFIPFKKGDVLYIYPPFNGKNVNNAINFSDGNFTNLGQITDSGSAYGICTVNNVALEAYKTTCIDGVSTLTYTDEFDSRVAYIRITHALYSLMDKDPTNFIVTVNEKIEL